MNCYMSIVKYKYMEPITVQVQVEDDELLECRVLKLMLQPIVENAILHGVVPSARGGLILIRVYGEGGDLFIEIMDNGPGMSREKMRLLLESGREEARRASTESACGMCMNESAECTGSRTVSRCSVKKDCIPRWSFVCRRFVRMNDPQRRQVEC